MALVSEILDRASRITGLRDTGSEREIGLQAINDAYLDILMETTSVVYQFTHQFVASSSVYPLLDDISALTVDDIVLPEHLGLLSVVYDNGSGYSYPLKQISEQEMLNYQEGINTVGYTKFYSMLGHKLMRVYPRPTVGSRVRIAYIPRPPELIEGDTAVQNFSAIWGTSVWNQFSWGTAGTTGQVISETFPSLIPPQFHWSVLLPAVVIQLLDKDQRTADVQFWMQRYQQGLNKMHEWMAQFGGDPTVVYDGRPVGYSVWPDQNTWWRY